MPTDSRLSRLAALAVAVMLAAALLSGGGITLDHPWDKLAHFAAFSLITLFLWRATGGEMPFLVLAGAISFGAVDEWRQAFAPGRLSEARDFLANLAGVLVTGTALLMQRKTPCAESSPR